MSNNERYIPKWLELYELLPPEEYTLADYENPKENQPGWYKLDERLLITIDVIRDIIGEPLICNTWFQDGSRRYSGLRSRNCKIGAFMSMHKEGKAADLICRKYTGEQMRQMIVENQDKLPFPIRIESNVEWLHFDLKDMDYKGKKIYFFKG